MKKSVLFGIASVLAAIFMAVGCEKGDQPGGDNGPGGDEPGQGTEYTLIATPTSVNFVWSSPSAQTVKVTTNAPEGFTVGEPAAWYTATKSGNDITIQPQTNDGDLRTHDLVITAPGANSVTITVSQDAKGEVHASLQGQKYIVWHLDEASRGILGDKIIAELGIFNFDIWNAGETFVFDDAVGPGFYGYQGSYMALKANNKGWSGGAYNYDATSENAIDLAPVWQEIIDADGEGWYFHVAARGEGESNAFKLMGPTDDEGLFVATKDYPGYNSADWTEIEVPMTEAIANGWTGALSGYTLSVYGGGATETHQYDALFIYKK